MCLYSRIIRNPKYKENKKNGGIIPPVYDDRVLWLPVGCGDCMECRQKKAREWTVRLMEDIKANRNGKMVTLTFSNESYAKLREAVIEQCNEKIAKLTIKKKEPKARKARETYNLPIWVNVDTEPERKYENPGDEIQRQKNEKQIEKLKEKMEGYALDNAIATLAVRRWNERWRKKHKKAVRHWLVTELGHNGTENIHLHGIVWTDKEFSEIKSTWGYGYMYPRSKDEERQNYVSERTINYSVKYIQKIDKDHRYYKSIILTSPGIGGNYMKSERAKQNRYRENGETIETFKTRTGHEIAIPIYWRNKIYTDEQKEKLWIEKLNKEVRWINGLKVDISKGEEGYYRILRQQQQRNKELGYGDGVKDWKRKEYEEQRRGIMQRRRYEKN